VSAMSPISRGYCLTVSIRFMLSSYDDLVYSKVVEQLARSRERGRFCYAFSAFPLSLATHLASNSAVLNRRYHLRIHIGLFKRDSKNCRKQWVPVPRNHPR
jgi:hypothetical protein